MGEPVRAQCELPPEAVARILWLRRRLLPWFAGSAASRSTGPCSTSGLSFAAPGALSVGSARCGPGASMPGRDSSNLLPAQVFFEADEALVADDDVVDQLDVQHAPRRHQLLCGLDVFPGGRGVAAGGGVAADEAGAVADVGGGGD